MTGRKISPIVFVLAFVSFGTGSGCTNQEVPPAPATAILSAPVPSVGPSDGICPGAEMSAKGLQPKVVVALADGGKLVACGGDRGGEFDSPKLQMAEFDVFHLDPTGKTVAHLLTATALDNFYVTDAGGKMVLEELFYSRNGWRTAFRSYIECPDGKCKRTPESCALDRKGLQSGEVLRGEVKRIREKVRAARAENRRHAYDEMEIFPLLDAALTGDAEALRFFERFPSESGVIDGASAEAYAEAQKLVKRLAKCP